MIKHISMRLELISLLDTKCSFFVAVRIVLLWIGCMVSAVILNSSFFLFPTLAKSLNFPIGVLFHADTLTPFPLPALVSPFVVMFDTHQTQDQCIRYILLYFSFRKFYEILRSMWLMDIHESCAMNNRTFGSWICSTWFVNFLYATQKIWFTVAFPEFSIFRNCWWVWVDFMLEKLF